MLEGSVRKSGDQFRITTQLIRAADGYHLWSETYDRKMDDIFNVQDEIAQEVVSRLKISLLGAVPNVRETDPEAYALTLQALAANQEMTPEGFMKADALLRQALAIDPRYVPAWDRLSKNFLNLTGQGLLTSEEGYARAREAAEKALEIDSDYAPAHARLGWIAMSQNDLAGAARHYERAYALDPADLEVLSGAAVFLRSLGRLDEASALMEALVRRDPLNVSRRGHLGTIQFDAGRYDAAIASYRTVLSLVPRGHAHFMIGLALIGKGDAPGALAEMELEKTELWRMIGLPMVYHALGREADSDAALAALIAKFEKTAAYGIAYVCAFRGDADKAFEWLDKAVQSHNPGLSEIVREKLFDNIRSDPRWLPFLRKIGKAPEQLARIEFKVTLPP